MNSKALFQKAQQYIPGGVNSPVRAFKAVGGTPVFVQRGEGAYIYDTDNKAYIDYVGSWGPLILGHAHPHVISKVQETMVKGLSFGMPTELEITLAQKITQMMPSIEMLRMVNSGTEATMSALRLAHGFTGRDKIIKFEGCYHGHNDALLVKAGSGALTFGVPSSPGIPKSFTEHTLVATFNDIDSVKQLFANHKHQIAAIIIEPVAGNMNCIPPNAGFLESLREICDTDGSLLIFDEVMTGFRVAKGGTQSYYNIKPDPTTLGKIIGGGMPVGAFGGRRDVMQFLSPLGPVYQAGTLSGNPVAMAAGLATLEVLEQHDNYPQLAKTTEQLANGIVECAKAHDIAMTYNVVGSMFGLFFTDKKISTFHDVMQCNVEQFKQFFHGMLDEGVHLAPSAFEAGFISIQHTNDVIAKTLNCAEKVFSRMSRE